MNKALNKTRSLYSRWIELQNVVSITPTISSRHPVSQEELEWTTTELRNALRSIEWDLEDLEDTIYILFIFISSCQFLFNFCMHLFNVKVNIFFVLKI